MNWADAFIYLSAAKGSQDRFGRAVGFYTKLGGGHWCIAVCQQHAEYGIDQGGVVADKIVHPRAVSDEHLQQAVDCAHFGRYWIYPIDLSRLFTR